MEVYSDGVVMVVFVGGELVSVSISPPPPIQHKPANESDFSWGRKGDESVL